MRAVMTMVVVALVSAAACSESMDELVGSTAGAPAGGEGGLDEAGEGPGGTSHRGAEDHAGAGGARPGAAGGAGEGGLGGGAGGETSAGLGGEVGTSHGGSGQAGEAPTGPCLDDISYAIPIKHVWAYTEPHVCDEHYEHQYDDEVKVTLAAGSVEVEASMYDIQALDQVPTEWNVTSTNEGYKATFSTLCGDGRLYEEHDGQGTLTFDCATRKATVRISCWGDVLDLCPYVTYDELWEGSVVVAE